MHWFEVTNHQLAEACENYYMLICALPEEVLSKIELPTFSKFISPSNYSMLPDTSQFTSALYTCYYSLSITGRQRFLLLTSPHKKTLFRAYIAKKYSV